MIVIDASAVVEIILRTDIGRGALDRLAEESNDAHAPHLVDTEVLHALRRLVLMHEVSVTEAELAVELLPQLQLERHSHLLLLPRMWELRNSVSAYDATYVALAEAMDAPLLTCDGKLSRSHGHHAEIVLLS